MSLGFGAVADGDEPAEDYVALLDGRPVGTAMIAAFVARVWRTLPDIDHLVVPVNTANVASWRALQSAGFRVVARGELEPDNPIDDRLHEILRIDRPGGG